MRGDAKSILRFLETNFVALSQFYRIQKQENLIVKETFFEICESSNPKINSQIIQEFQIVKRNVNGDFEMPIDYEKFIGFLLNDFKQTLTDSLENQSKGLVTLFDKLKDANNDSNTTISIINSIIDLIKNLCADIEKQTYQLWQEYLDLKINKDGNYNYVSKLEKVNFWIKNYIEPLNAILNHHHTESIIHTVRQIKMFANERKETHKINEIRFEFDKLNDQLLNADFDLQSQSKRLTDTLLPLIDRIKTEHQILSGFIEILKSTKNKEEVKFLPLFRRSRFLTYNIDFNIAKEFEKYKEQSAIYAEEPDGIMPSFWHFDKEYYKNKLVNELPLNNFFLWCYNTLNQEYEIVENDKFFALTTLIFETDIVVELSEKSVALELFNETIVAPIIKIENGNKLSKAT